MNTTTHNIRAAYTVGDTGEWHAVDINGDDFAEVVDDMLSFWNGADNLAEAFTVASTFREDDFTTVVEIAGAVYGDDNGIVDMPIDPVIVHVTATER